MNLLFNVAFINFDILMMEGNEDLDAVDQWCAREMDKYVEAQKNSQGGSYKCEWLNSGR